MKQVSIFAIISLLASCTNYYYPDSKKNYFTTTIEINPLFENDSLSIRAIEVTENGGFVFAANNNTYGYYSPGDANVYSNQLRKEPGKKSDYRGVYPVTNGLCMISAGNPALIYKIDTVSQTEKIVYFEEGDDVFYDALQFWNDKEGIAFGDAVGNCMSVLLTKDGGENWEKIPCNHFPKSYQNEGAFAASNSNISTQGSKAWLASKSRVYLSSKNGLNWSVVNTPIIHDESSQGIYSIDFYDKNIGIAIGGDFSKPKQNEKNVIYSRNGGKDWYLFNGGEKIDYRSCIKFIPEEEGAQVIAVGKNGISLSLDGGFSWETLDNSQDYYTIRFNSRDSGYLAGNGKISSFKINRHRNGTRY